MSGYNINPALNDLAADVASYSGISEACLAAEDACDCDYVIELDGLTAKRFDSGVIALLTIGFALPVETLADLPRNLATALRALADRLEAL